jgi:hypothetical protein
MERSWPLALLAITVILLALAPGIPITLGWYCVTALVVRLAPQSRAPHPMPAKPRWATGFAMSPSSGTHGNHQRVWPSDSAIDGGSGQPGPRRWSHQLPGQRRRCAVRTSSSSGVRVATPPWALAFPRCCHAERSLAPLEVEPMRAPVHQRLLTSPQLPHRCAAISGQTTKRQTPQRKTGTRQQSPSIPARHPNRCSSANRSDPLTSTSTARAYAVPHPDHTEALSIDHAVGGPRRPGRQARSALSSGGAIPPRA